MQIVFLDYELFRSIRSGEVDLIEMVEMSLHGACFLELPTSGGVPAGRPFEVFGKISFFNYTFPIMLTNASLEIRLHPFCCLWLNPDSPREMQTSSNSFIIV